MLLWGLNLDFAASGSDAPDPPPVAASTRLGTPLLIGAGCWVAPLLVAALMGVR